jgi:BMFP domain-containing protein YqiC
MARDRVETLECRVRELERQLEASQAHNRDISKQIKDLSLAMG